jgi:hypothetical protein
MSRPTSASFARQHTTSQRSSPPNHCRRWQHPIIRPRILSDLDLYKMFLSSDRIWRTSRPPVLLKFRSSTQFIGFSCFIATFTDGFLYGAIVPVLPYSLVERSGVPEDMVQNWLSTLLATFGLTMTIGAPLTAWAINSLASRKTVFLAGLGVAFLSTLLFTLGRAPWILVVARAFQGLSAPMINMAALVLVTDSVDRNHIGYW